MNIGGGSQSGVFTNPSGATAFSNPTAGGAGFGTGMVIFGGDEEEDIEESVSNRPTGVCVPAFSPGLNFWSGTAQQDCGIASAKCIVVYEEDIFGGQEKIVEGEECLSDEWAVAANRICSGLGDCGGNVNYVGRYTDDGYDWKIDGVKREFSQNTVNIISRGGSITGRIVAFIDRIF
jgi:hypothetical protein